MHPEASLHLDEQHLGVEPSILETGHSNQIAQAQSYTPSFVQGIIQRTNQARQSPGQKPAKRDPYSMCSQYGTDPNVFTQCIKFYVEQNKQID